VLTVELSSVQFTGTVVFQLTPRDQNPASVHVHAGAIQICAGILSARPTQQQPCAHDVVGNTIHPPRAATSVLIQATSGRTT